jgi:hypothetical protein
MTNDQAAQQDQLEYLQPCLAAGPSHPPGWQPISSLRLIIIVGVTGTGKTTATENLAEQGLNFELLPDRRFLTDKLIIAPLQREDGQEVKTLPRIQRVPYIRRYKQRHPAGLAYAISKLFVDPRTCDDFWVFNGLRGQEEVRYAIEAIPKAEFIVLDADDIVRAERLIKRKDPYDRMIKRKKEHNPVIEKIDSFEAIGIPEAAEMFSPEEERQLLEIAENKSTSFVEIANILKLLWIERSLYDKDATIATLRSLAPQRTCVIDTTDLHPNEVTHEIIGRLRELELIE